ncbi:hypothetical protein [Pseudonocardia cypriaca]|uniref:Uncharacterized protein n=1 Tax=Pseudonocardia cypriaca TaxID=882449 RepID=A0A543FSR8_9PSEU|nr:hypothetical protein [Pseudonocardia cypriaca]TQM36875.1 hypothetical protein FB388_4062 [Pseudonocardia cypriaca]
MSAVVRVLIQCENVFNVARRGTWNDLFGPLIFLISQRYFIQGITVDGLEG